MSGLEEQDRDFMNCRCGRAGAYWEGFVREDSPRESVIIYFNPDKYLEHSSYHPKVVVNSMNLSIYTNVRRNREKVDVIRLVKKIACAACRYRLSNTEMTEMLVLAEKYVHTRGPVFLNNDRI